MHLYKELTSLFILTPNIDDAVLFQWAVRNKFYRNIFHTLDLMFLVKRQKGVEQANNKIGMLAKDAFESEVCSWI